MRAIVQTGYGSPADVLELRDIDIPEIGDDEVLVRVRAASVHPDVWHVVRGWPYFLRLIGSGLRKPKLIVPGTDMAGRVESVGDDVTRFRPGDEVFGECVRGHQWKNGGAYAEFVSVAADALEGKPDSATFEQAAAVPTAGLIALANLGRAIQPGHNVLINGGGGGVGMFAIQIAKSYGANVTGVDNTDKQGLMRSIGADSVIDYTQDDFTQNGERYDFILDIPGNRSFEDLKRAIAEDGKYVYIGHDQFGSANRWIGAMGRFIRLGVLAPFGRSKKGPRPPKNLKTPLVQLKELLEAGTLTPVIDRAFPLSEVSEAIAYLQDGHARGRIVITI